MNPALRAAATGMMAQQLRTEVISNNLANVNTTGFKRSRAHFEDLLYQTVQGSSVVGAPEAGTTPAIQVGPGRAALGGAAAARAGTAGADQPPARPRDRGRRLLPGRSCPTATSGYTRDGSFTISDEGMLTTQGGYTVLPGISVPDDATNLGISRTGIVTATTARRRRPVELGRLELARFTNPTGLLAAGENVYTETPGVGRCDPRVSAGGWDGPPSPGPA
jgi:flagellar basal-body rod protein FlgG